MTLSDISIKRPVLATVMCLTLVLFGAISFFRLPIRESPDIDPPVVSITTVYPGASARVMEVEVSQVLDRCSSTGCKGPGTSGPQQASR